MKEIIINLLHFGINIKHCDLLIWYEPCMFINASFMPFNGLLFSWYFCQLLIAIDLMHNFLWKHNLVAQSRLTGRWSLGEQLQQVGKCWSGNHSCAGPNSWNETENSLSDQRWFVCKSNRCDWLTSIFQPDYNCSPDDHLLISFDCASWKVYSRGWREGDNHGSN